MEGLSVAGDCRQRRTTELPMRGLFLDASEATWRQQRERSHEGLWSVKERSATSPVSSLRRTPNTHCLVNGGIINPYVTLLSSDISRAFDNRSALESARENGNACILLFQYGARKLSYCRRTARRAMSVEILSM